MKGTTPSPGSPGFVLKPNRVVCAFLIGIFLAGCSPKFSTTAVFRDGIFEVRLQQAIGPDGLPVARGYDHPAEFSNEDLVRILESVKIRYARGFFERTFSGERPEVDSAFSGDEIDRMVTGLAQAFAAATPDDRIEFVFRHRRGVFSAGISTGVLFVKDGKFNAILANYRASDKQPDGNTPGGRYQDPLEKIAARTHQLIPGPYQEIHSSEDPGLQDRWLVIDYKNLLTSAPEAPSEMRKGDQTIEQKLDTLKRLLDKGLITRDDYETKKKELLKDY